jgi:hypothetical protein
MVSWLVDHTSWLYLLLICAALGCLSGWWVTRKRKFLIGLGAVAGAAGLVFLLSFLDTDRKRLVRTLQEMVTAFQERKLDRTFALIADDCVAEFAGVTLDKPELRAKAEQAISYWKVERIHLSAFQFEKVDPPTAEVTFNAKSIGQVTGSDYFCWCQAEFRLDKDGQWRMTHLRVHKPF